LARIEDQHWSRKEWLLQAEHLALSKLRWRPSVITGVR
jgi:hypothetical protein